MNNSIKSRRDHVSEETRLLLETSASALFAACKYEEVSIDQIAANAGLTKGAFYHHFPTKSDVFEACYRAQINRIVQFIQTTDQPNDSPTMALQRANTFVTYVLHHHKQLIGLDKAISVLGWSRWKKMDTEAFYPLITEPLALMQSQGLLSVQSIPLLADMLHGILFNAIMAMSQSENPNQTMGMSMEIFKSFFLSLLQKNDSAF